jgi:hypothetical protein
MTPDERARILAEAEKAGVDLSLLRDNLRLTPNERVERHQQALARVLAFRNACRLPVEDQRLTSAPATEANDAA